MTDIDPHHVKAGTIREVMLSHASAAPAKRGADPGDIARAIVGKDEKKWRQLMKPIKDEAVRMAKDGKLVLLRKGKQVSRQVGALPAKRLQDWVAAQLG